MIDKIVQMSVREYESLQRTAKYKEKQIKEEALKLWKEKGVSTIKITFDYREGNCVPYEHIVDCSAFVWYKDGIFTIPEPLRSRIQDIVKRNSQYFIDDYIGEPLKLWNSLEREQIKLSRLSRILWLIASSGWGVAAVLFCV